MGVCGYSDREQSLKRETAGPHGNVVERGKKESGKGKCLCNLQNLNLMNEEQSGQNDVGWDVLGEAGVDDQLLQVPDEKMTNVRLMCHMVLKQGK